MILVIRSGITTILVKMISNFDPNHLRKSNYKAIETNLCSLVETEQIRLKKKVGHEW
ncbi:unnamed protein product [Coffea canephora]|uniref:Uncharacterized protein n=1 Tax=Coffea canephora TaxID=49390 RepID=A0A068UUA4_COFCA|nr:unnamed protein product [Coffea canephora]